MKKLKVVVYAICKNEAAFVNRWIASMSEADEMIVTDTGSADDTVKMLRESGAVVYEETINPWRFDRARNISLGHVPEDADICVCTDLDEVFEAGWREKLEAAWQPGTTQAKYWYNWSLKADGTPDVQLRYFKIHARGKYVWVYPVHECLEYVGKGPEQRIFVDGIVLNHYPDDQKSRSSYLGLLELAVNEYPNDSRMAYYLGREYMYKGMWQQSAEALIRYLNLPGSRWREERCAAMRWIAKCCFMLKSAEEAYGWYFRAVAECPGMRDPYIEFAKAAFEYADWETVYYMSLTALKIKNKSTSFTNMGYAWDHTPYNMLAVSSYYLGDYQKSLNYARSALELSPDNKMLIDNLAIIKAKAASVDQK